MADLKITTKKTLGTPSSPEQRGDPNEFFGEQTNDLQIDTLSDFASIEGIEKLKQDIKKILLTERGENDLFPLYGTNLQTLIGGKINFENIRARIKTEIVEALQVLQFINRENPNEDEQPDILESIRVEQIDPTSFDIQLSVKTVSGKSVSTGLIVTA